MATGTEGDDGRFLGRIALGVVEGFDCGLVDRVAGDADAAIDEVADGLDRPGLEVGRRGAGGGDAVDDVEAGGLALVR